LEQSELCLVSSAASEAMPSDPAPRLAQKHVRHRMAGYSGHAVAANIIEGEKMNIIEKQLEEKELVISVIGAGGIGSLLVPALARALCAGELVKEIGPVLLQVFDGDIVEETNLQHQNFNSSDVGSKKVDALVASLRHCQTPDLRIVGVPVDVRTATPIVHSDITIVAVDSMPVRNLVHRYSELWLDLRCQGDGFVAFDFRVDSKVVSQSTPLEAPSASCQLPGAVESGNIQFGHHLAAAHGAQWLVQCLRIISGQTMASMPNPQSANISFGTLGRFELDNINLKPKPSNEAINHPSQLIIDLVSSGNHDALPIKETLAHHAYAKDWQSLWNLADSMGREVSLLFDAEDKVWVDIGTAGQVKLSPPEGAKIPFKLWIHTHPRDAYWSSTDLDSILMFSRILEQALVLGHDHCKRSIRMPTTVRDNLEDGSELSLWTDEPTVKYESLEVVVNASR